MVRELRMWVRLPGAVSDGLVGVEKNLESMDVEEEDLEEVRMSV